IGRLLRNFQIIYEVSVLSYMNLIFTESCDNTVSNSRFGIGNSAFVTLSERDFICVKRQNLRWSFRKERKKKINEHAFKY
ncbi:MAG: hypothetical protein ACK56I_00305, partial [bacterium]